MLESEGGLISVCAEFVGALLQRAVQIFFTVILFEDTFPDNFASGGFGLNMRGFAVMTTRASYVHTHFQS
jgi:hypothetical protein